MRINLMVCDACKEPILDMHCTPHMEHLLDEQVSDIHYHIECCPCCHAEDEAMEEATWLAFVENERFHETVEEMGL